MTLNSSIGRSVTQEKWRCLPLGRVSQYSRKFTSNWKFASFNGAPFNWALWQRLATKRPDLLSLPGPEGLFTPGVWTGMTIALSFGMVFQPHMMIRYYTAASARTLKWLRATTPIYLMTLYIPAAMVGLGGALVLPDIEVADRIFPELLFNYAPAWLTGLILAGATAAAMADGAPIATNNDADFHRLVDVRLTLDIDECGGGTELNRVQGGMSARLFSW